MYPELSAIAAAVQNLDPSVHGGVCGEWMAGFEGADHRDARGIALIPARETGHLHRVQSDYQQLQRLGIRAVRETVGWRIAEPASGRYDFSRIRAMLAAAQRAEVQILWTLVHYGLPDDLSIDDPRLIGRFERFCRAFAHEAGAASAALAGGAPVSTPVNEIGFHAYALAHTGFIHRHRPEGDAATQARAGFGYQCRLVELSIAGIHALREVEPRALMMSAEPLINVAAAVDTTPESIDRANECSARQWPATDLLTGLVEPGLGGTPAMIDWVGLNYYHNSQWELDSQALLAWQPPDARRVSLDHQLEQAFVRYGRPLVLAETSHLGAGRGPWLDEVTDALCRAHARDLPMRGVCPYPALARPDWQDQTRWLDSGIRDLPIDGHVHARLPRLAWSYAHAPSGVTSVVGRRATIRRLRCGHGLAHVHCGRSSRPRRETYPS